MLITVVTVCLNCEGTIEKTILSVIEQKGVQFEYLILDGCSTDNTLKIAKKYAAKYSNIRLYSEKDEGVYDAMNKASKLAQGKYVYFLNAGDSFYNRNVLKNVSDFLTSGKDIYYGNTKIAHKIETYPKRLKYQYLVLREKMVCHQAIFAKKDVLCEYPFDLSLRICADRDWLIQMVKTKKKCQYMSDIIVANYDCNGISSDYRKFEKDSMTITKKYGGILAIFIVKVKRMIGKIISR